MAISQLNANEIINIASNYKSNYDLNDEEEDEIKKILIEKRNIKNFIYSNISQK